MYRYKFIIFLISNPAMKKIYELNDPPSELEERKGYFIDFVTTKKYSSWQHPIESFPEGYTTTTFGR
jgi:hypothetical protein